MQLLKITNIPIEYEIKIQRSKLEMKQSNPQIHMETQGGHVHMESENIKVRLDTYEARSSIGLKSSGDFADDLARLGKQAANDATAQYAEIGNRMAQIQHDATLADAVYPRMVRQSSTAMVFLPAAGPDISWEPNHLSLDYEPVELSMEPQVIPVETTFVPGGLSIEIIQYPKVEIEYLGEPMYVPPSANPNYEEEKKD